MTARKPQRAEARHDTARQLANVGLRQRPLNYEVRYLITWLSRARDGLSGIYALVTAVAGFRRRWPPSINLSLLPPAKEHSAHLNDLVKGFNLITKRER